MDTYKQDQTLYSDPPSIQTQTNEVSPLSVPCHTDAHVLGKLMNIHAQKQREERKPGSYLDCFRGLTLDVMGHAGSLVHVSGPWTVHVPRWSSGCTRDQVSFLGLQLGCCCCFCCCRCCFLTPEAETLSDWRDLYLSPKKKHSLGSSFSKLLAIRHRKLKTVSIHLHCTFSVLRCDSFTVQPMILALILPSKG